MMKILSYLSLTLLLVGPLMGQRDNRVDLSRQVRGVLNDENIPATIARDSEVPATTDALAEGSANKYFSQALARGALAGGTNVTYSSATGVISVVNFPWGSLTSVPSLFPPDLTGVAEDDLADSGCATVSFSATPAFNAAVDKCFEITLTGDVTSSTLSGETPGRDLSWTITQDATGGHDFEWPTQVTNACDPSTQPDSVTLIKGRVDSEGVTITECRVKGGVDSITTTCVSPSLVPTPASGKKTWFCDNLTGEASVKDDGGNLVSLESGGGGSGADPQGRSVGFVAQTSVSLNHDFGTIAYSEQCFDSSGNEIHADSTPTRTTTDITWDFAGVSTTGTCVVIPGGRGNPTNDTFVSQTSLTISAATHGKGCSGVMVVVYDNSSPRQRLNAGWTYDSASTCDIAVDLGSVAVTGMWTVQ